jgi:hypothetical protein
MRDFEGWKMAKARSWKQGLSLIQAALSATAQVYLRLVTSAIKPMIEGIE